MICEIVAPTKPADLRLAWLKLVCWMLAFANWAVSIVAPAKLVPLSVVPLKSAPIIEHPEKLTDETRAWLNLAWSKIANVTCAGGIDAPCASNIA